MSSILALTIRLRKTLLIALACPVLGLGMVASTKAQDSSYLIKDALTLPPGQYASWRFDIHSGPARVFGRCIAADSIPVFGRIVDPNQFENYKLMGERENAQYNLSCDRGFTVDTTLGPGRYFLVISNNNERAVYIEVDIRGASR